MRWLVFLFFFFFKFLYHPISSIIGQRNFLKFLFDLFSDDFLANISLRARSFPFCATQIIVSFLSFGSDKTTAFSATKHSSIDVWFYFSCFLAYFFISLLLELGQKVSFDNRFVLSFVVFAIVSCHSVIERILKKILIIGDRKQFAFSSSQS